MAVGDRGAEPAKAGGPEARTQTGATTGGPGAGRQTSRGGAAHAPRRGRRPDGPARAPPRTRLDQAAGEGRRRRTQADPRRRRRESMLSTRRPRHTCVRSTSARSRQGAASSCSRATRCSTPSLAKLDEEFKWDGATVTQVDLRLFSLSGDEVEALGRRHIAARPRRERLGSPVRPGRDSAGIRMRRRPLVDACVRAHRAGRAILGRGAARAGRRRRRIRACIGALRHRGRAQGARSRGLSRSHSRASRSRPRT